MPRFKNENHTVVKVCPTCKKEFASFQSLKRIYCSAKCYHQGGNKKCKPENKVIKKCDYCGKNVVRPASNFHSKKTFCDYICMAKWQSVNTKKQNHPRWTGGTRNAKGVGWKAARDKARTLSNGKCKMCGKTAKDVHHKIPVRCFKKPSDAHHQSNLIVLCHSCHPKMEKVFRETRPLLDLIQWQN